MDQNMEKRFDRLEDKVDGIAKQMGCLVRMDERQKNMTESIKHQGKRLGAQEIELNAHKEDTATKFQAYDKSNWKHHAISNFIERTFWLAFTTCVAYIIYNLKFPLV